MSTTDDGAAPKVCACKMDDWTRDASSENGCCILCGGPLNDEPTRAADDGAAEVTFAEPYIECLGWQEDEDKSKRFTATVVFPAGPPDGVTFATVWERRPVRLVFDPAPVEPAGDPVRDGGAVIAYTGKEDPEFVLTGLLVTVADRLYEASKRPGLAHFAEAAARVLGHVERRKAAAPQPDPDRETAITTLLTQLGSRHEAYPDAKRDLVRAFLAQHGTEAQGDVGAKEGAVAFVERMNGTAGRLFRASPTPMLSKEFDYLIDLARRGARAPVAGGEPVAWACRLAHTYKDGVYSDWRPHIGAKPNVPSEAIRALEPLYAHPPAPSAPTADDGPYDNLIEERGALLNSVMEGKRGDTDRDIEWARIQEIDAELDAAKEFPTTHFPHGHQAPPAALEKPAWLRDEVNPDPSPRFRFWNRRKFEWTGTDWIMHLGELPHVHHHPDNVPSQHLDAIVDAALTHIANEAPPAAVCDHVWRGSDASTFDAVCTKCGITDTQKERRRQAPPAAPVEGVSEAEVDAAFTWANQYSGDRPDFSRRWLRELLTATLTSRSHADRSTPTPDDGCPKGDPDCLGGNGDCHDACSTFAERGAVDAAVAAERERCAQIVESVTRTDGTTRWFPARLYRSKSSDSIDRLAAAIRSRASTPAPIDGLAPHGRDGTEG